MPKNTFLLQNYRWNEGGAKPIAQVYYGKEKLFAIFDDLRQQLIAYEITANQYQLKNHQDWVIDVFAILINADKIIKAFEVSEELSDVYGVTVRDRLKEEADLLDELADMPVIELHDLDDSSETLLGNQIEDQYLQVRKAIYAVHTTLIGA
jgi:hypothetical protein